MRTVSKTVNPGSNPGSPARPTPLAASASRTGGRTWAGRGLVRAMSSPQTSPVPLATTRAFVEEVLRTGLLLTTTLGDLLDELPDDAFPGEEPAEVLLDMVAGSAHPAAAAVGAPAVRQATALLGAVADRTIADLAAAADAARDLADEAA